MWGRYRMVFHGAVFHDSDSNKWKYKENMNATHDTGLYEIKIPSCWVGRWKRACGGLNVPPLQSVFKRPVANSANLAWFSSLSRRVSCHEVNFHPEGVKIQQILIQCFMFQAVQSLLRCSSFNAENHRNRTHILQQRSANNNKIHIFSIALQSVGAMLQWTLQKPQFVEITRPNRTITSSRTSPWNGQFLWDLLSPSRKSIKSKLQLVIWSWCFGLAFRLCHFSSKRERDTFSNWA